jgi:hypothetical protein
MKSEAKGMDGGKLINRHADYNLRVQRPNGQIVDVTPLPEDEEQAGRLWGGGAVSYYLLADGSRIFAGARAQAIYGDWGENEDD